MPLSGKKFPRSAEELESAINGALADVFEVPSAGGATVSGGKYPAVKTIKIDLDDARVSIVKPPPRLVGTGKRDRGPTVQKLDLSAQPVRYVHARLNLKLNAADVQFDFDRDKRGRPLLVLTGARAGTVDARITKRDLRGLLLDIAAVAGQEQGVTIQELDMALEPVGKRAVAADVRVKARKLVFSGVVRVTCRLDIDDELNATLSELNCTGEGVIGAAAAGVMQKKVSAFEGRTIPLMAFSLGDLSLRDLRFDVRRDLHVSASFGSGATA